MMKTYLLFLLGIIVICQANEVSWSTQQGANSGQRRNDLNSGANLDEESGRSDRNIRRSAYEGSVYEVRTRDVNDGNRRAGNLREHTRPPTFAEKLKKIPTYEYHNAWRVGSNQESNVGRANGLAQAVSDSKPVSKKTSEQNVPIVVTPVGFDNEPFDHHLLRQSRSLPVGVNVVNPAYVQNNNLSPGAYVLRSNDLSGASGYVQKNYLNRADKLSQDDYARRNIGSSVPIVRAGNDLNNLYGTGQELNVENTSYNDRATPIVRAENYGNVYSVDGINQKPDVKRSEPKNDISRSDSVTPEAQMNRHGYNQPVSDIERKQRNQYVPPVLNAALIDNNTNNGLDSTPNKGYNLPGFDPIEDYSLLSDAYGPSNVGYEAPYDGYGINDGTDFFNLTPNNGYGGLDYNMLAPDFENFRENDVSLLTKNKITNDDLIAAYNESTDQLQIDNSTNQKVISDRGGFFDDDSGYIIDHRGFHTFSDDSTNNDGTPDVVEISSNSAPMNGECYCNTNNGHRVCHNCDQQCEGANCHHVNTQTHTTTTHTCELCKVRETTTPKPIVCDICKLPPPPPTPTPPSPPPPSPPVRCFDPCKPQCDPCKQRESSCEQSCSCGCNYCKHTSCCNHGGSGCCKHSCHSCKQKKPNCSSCEYGQNFDYGNVNGNNYYAENGNNHFSEKRNDHYEDNGNNHYGDNVNNHYGHNGNNNYGENENNYYKEHNKMFDDYYKKYNNQHGSTIFAATVGTGFNEGAVNGGGAFAGNAGGGFAANTGAQFHANALEESGSSDGTVALFSNTDLVDTSVGGSMSSNSGSSATSISGSSISNIGAISKSISASSSKSISAGNSKSKGGGSIKKTTIKITTGSGNTGGSSSSGYSSSTTYGNSSPHNQLFSSFSQTGLFGNNLLPGNPFGR